MFDKIRSKSYTTTMTAKRKNLPKARKIAKLQPLLERPADTFDGVARTRMRIIGIGGGGSNIVSEISQKLQKADFVAANTDAQALKSVGRNTKRFAFGQNLTKGLGCGMDAKLGELAAQEDQERVKKLLEGQDLCVLIASLGGGTGSGAVPVFAQFANDLKNLTVGIFTMPFAFEGEKREQLALDALEKLKPLLNAYVIIPNDRIFQIVEKNAPLRFALSSINKKLSESLEGFIETLFLPGLINIDFADVRALLQGKGRLAYVSSVTASGEDRVKLALDQVLADHLYDYQSKGAERIFFNIAGSKDLKMDEVAQISKKIFEQNPRAKIIFGISSNQQFHRKLRITVFAIGCEGKTAQGQTIAPKIKVLPLKTKSASKKLSAKKTKKLEEKPGQSSKEAIPAITAQDPQKQRRNAIEVKKAIDEEIEEFQQEEKKWDIPAFLRSKKN